jgi:uncharacterized protein (TIGR03000 family)
MQAYDAATRKLWWRKAVIGTWVVLALAAIGLPNSQAQMRYSGGFVQYHRHPPPDTLKAAPPSSSTTTSPPSYFPDNDSYYPGAETGRSVPPSAGTLPFGVSAVLPWNQAGFAEYAPLSAPPESSFSASKAYTLKATPLLGEPPAGKAETAMLIVHLPEEAMLWVEGRSIALRGQTNYFSSPPLNPGKRYIYTVRAAWLEKGRWVSRTREVPVAAGLIQALYLLPSPALPGKKNLPAG